MERGLVATVPPDVSIATVPFDRAVARVRDEYPDDDGRRHEDRSEELQTQRQHALPRTAGCSWLLSS